MEEKETRHLHTIAQASAVGLMLSSLSTGFAGQDVDPEFPTHPSLAMQVIPVMPIPESLGLRVFDAGADDDGPPPPQVGPNTQVNDPQSPFPDGLLGRSETTIAADPSGRFLLVGWNDADGFCLPPFNLPCTPADPTPGINGFGFSSDGGQTWIDGGVPFPVVTPKGTKVTRGDPWVDTGGSDGQTYYYANLAVDTTTTSPGGGGMVVHRGRFEHSKFAFNNGVFITSPNAPNDDLDKEALCAGKAREGGDYDENEDGFSDDVTVSVTNFVEVAGNAFSGFGQIEAYVSTNRASSFPTRTIIQPDETNRPAVNQGSTCAYGPEGELYVVWERGFLSPFFGQGDAGVWPQILMARSDDRGHSFGSPTLVSDISAAALFPPAGYNRFNHNDFPRIAIAQSGPFKGRVYVTYHDSRIANGGTQAETGGNGNVDADVYVRFSDDKGTTWSAPIQVAGGGDGKIQFWPVVSVRPNGEVVVTYNESVETDGTSLVDVFLARSTDGGQNYATPIRVTEVTTDWGATDTDIIPNFGDYIFHVSTAGPAAVEAHHGPRPHRKRDDDGGKDHVTWADGRNGVPDVFYTTVTSGEED